MGALCYEPEGATLSAGKQSPGLRKVKSGKIDSNKGLFLD